MWTAGHAGDSCSHSPTWRSTGSSARFYDEDAHADTPAEPATVPIGLVSVAGEVRSIRWFVDRDHENVVSWHGYTVGGHYAAHQAPDLLADEG